MKLPQYLKNLVMVLSTILFLSACSTAPRIVKADIPLVDANRTTIEDEPVSSRYWSALNEPTSRVLRHDHLQIGLGPIYTSALGHSCRTLSIHTELNTVFRVACRIGYVDDSDVTPWFLRNSLVKDSSNITL